MESDGCFSDRKKCDDSALARHAQAGFTLVELLAALVVAIPMLILMFKVVPGMMKSSHYAHSRTQGTFLASQQLETILNQIRSTHPSYGFNHNYAQATQAFGAPFGDYKSQISDTTVGSLKTLNVTVWQATLVDAPIALNTVIVQ